MKNIVESIKLNQENIEKWMMSQAAKEILNLYVSMPTGTVPGVVQKQTETIYLEHGEDDEEVRHFSNTWKTLIWKF